MLTFVIYLTNKHLTLLKRQLIRGCDQNFSLRNCAKPVTSQLNNADFELKIYCSKMDPFIQLKKETTTAQSQRGCRHRQKNRTLSRTPMPIVLYNVLNLAFRFIFIYELVVTRTDEPIKTTVSQGSQTAQN